jgi:lipopolysaccharide export system permease protein
VSFFVIYYVIILLGEKLARDGACPAYIGMWISTYILFPIAIYLTYKAATDSNLMSGDWYYNQWIRFKEWKARGFRRESKKTKKSKI